ncbi:unnamed protein product [Scytosiphon promiscuus]
MERCSALFVLGESRRRSPDRVASLISVEMIGMRCGFNQRKRKMREENAACSLCFSISVFSWIYWTSVLSVEYSRNDFFVFRIVNTERWISRSARHPPMFPSRFIPAYSVSIPRNFAAPAGIVIPQEYTLALLCILTQAVYTILT